MYNLLVSGSEDAWSGKRHFFELSRLGEHTAAPLKERYRSLDPKIIPELLSFPALFAYEQVCELSARVGRVTRIAQPSGRDFKFEFTLDQAIPPIPPGTLSALAFELDISAWELNRTHWAIKDVDLFEVLTEAGLLPQGAAPQAEVIAPSEPARRTSPILAPTVFSIPEGDQQPNLVAVMMPFGAEFSNVYAAIRLASERAGLECQRADDIWEHSTIVQDVFALIYRSAVVVADLSGLNPNVMYEVGIAHTLGRPVVPIANAVNMLPFDLAHHRTLGYLPNGEGLNDLVAKLERKLKQYRSE